MLVTRDTVKEDYSENKGGAESQTPDGISHLGKEAETFETGGLSLKRQSIRLKR